MKKLFSIVASLFIATIVMGQQPVITFEKTSHDFGQINEGDGRVTTVFNFKNEGMQTLVLSNVRASCGCTTPKWPREPIEPGQTGQITVTYNPNGRPGRFQKTVTVTSNASEPTVRLFIKGEVIPKQAKPVNNYPVKMGDLSLKTNTIKFGDVLKTAQPSLTIEYTNLTDKEITVDYAIESSNTWLQPQMSIKTVPSKQVGQLTVALDAKACPMYGPVSAKLYMIVNGKKVISNEYAITITADLKEDFSKLTSDQMRLAPIAEMGSTIDLGTIAAGKTVKKSFSIKNIGHNPLAVRRIISTAGKITITAPKGSIKSGKSSEIKMVLTAETEATTYLRTLTVITNDPKNPVKTVTLKWNVK